MTSCVQWQQQQQQQQRLLSRRRGSYINTKKERTMQRKKTNISVCGGAGMKDADTSNSITSNRTIEFLLQLLLQKQLV